MIGQTILNDLSRFLIHKNNFRINSIRASTSTNLDLLDEILFLVKTLWTLVEDIIHPLEPLLGFFLEQLLPTFFGFFNYLFPVKLLIGNDSLSNFGREFNTFKGNFLGDHSILFVVWMVSHEVSQPSCVGRNVSRTLFDNELKSFLIDQI